MRGGRVDVPRGRRASARGWLVVNQGVLFIRAGDGNLYALHADNGNKVWSFGAGDPLSSPTIGQ